MDEYFDIVDDNNHIVGRALRSECHGNPSLIHKTVHVVVFHPDGRLLLQKRRMDKDVQPGKWDTAVGGHVDAGETFETAVRRELAEEIGVVDDVELEHIFDSKIRNEIESENVRVYGMTSSGPFKYQEEEIDELRFWSRLELESAISATPEIFTPNVIAEIERLWELDPLE